MSSESSIKLTNNNIYLHPLFVPIILLKLSFLFHRFSIDISLSAVAISFFTANQNNTHLPASQLFLLGSTVFLIYNLDHWFDERKSQKSSLANGYLWASILGFVLSISLTFLQPLKFIICGIGLAGIVGCYILIFSIFERINQTRFIYLKEIMVGCLFSLGVIFPIAYQFWDEDSLTVLLNNTKTISTLNLLALNWLVIFIPILHNTEIFSFLNRDKDYDSNQYSLFLKLEELGLIYYFQRGLTLLGFAGIILILSFSYLLTKQQVIYWTGVIIAQQLIFNVLYNLKTKINENLMMTAKLFLDSIYLLGLLVFLLTNMF